MTDQIKVSEVSAILRQQLEGISTGIRTEEVGTVLQVSDGVARIYGLDNAEANELLQFDNGMEAIVPQQSKRSVWHTVFPDSAVPLMMVIRTSSNIKHNSIEIIRHTIST